MKKLKTFFWLIIILLVVISVGLVVRRTLILLHIVQAVPRGAKFGFETGLKDYPALTILHIVPGLLFVLLGPLLLYNRKRLTNRRQQVFACIFICSVFLVAISAILMPFITMPLGGLNEAAAAILYGIIFLLEAFQLLKAMLNKNCVVYREWLIRTIALGLAIATTRPVMVLAFTVYKVSPEVFLGTAFWIAFTIHLCVAETWLYCSGTTQKQLR